MVAIPRKTAVGTAHSKLILIGEHAVVYGKPAIALPFPAIEARATIEEINNNKTISFESPYYSGPYEEIPGSMEGIAVCINETMKCLMQKPEGLRICLESTIPLGRGLGSSAAIAISIVRGLFLYFGQVLNDEKLKELVHIAETFAHGNPSGIDAAASSNDHPIWFQRGSSIASLEIGGPFYLVVADSGRIGNTRGAVESIKEMYNLDAVKTEQSLNALEANTFKAKSALIAGEIDLLGNTLDAAQRELTLLGVSDSGIDRLVSAAKEKGALGAKLTGGGRGGCILALAKNHQHAKELEEALLTAGAFQTWSFEVGKN
ncbi:mevalonate kinase [Sporosarcina sp. Marseille-Q4063]|uniref:mevalonate kinase n=1 Tax=Sporosarcina sp. Marseille-Q4063 TaxID=2810514 RepID=UPI001BAF9BB7|nr:mevalonate kinase [Sporosarcina sp. Marseille-Q4063]QUW22360.1 mevalonate kinase [Sporosarcina sp. Marseille-Q4063]